MLCFSLTTIALLSFASSQVDAIIPTPFSNILSEEEAKTPELRCRTRKAFTPAQVFSTLYHREAWVFISRRAPVDTIHREPKTSLIVTKINACDVMLKCNELEKLVDQLKMLQGYEKYRIVKGYGMMGDYISMPLYRYNLEDEEALQNKDETRIATFAAQIMELIHDINQDALPIDVQIRPDAFYLDEATGEIFLGEFNTALGFFSLREKYNPEFPNRLPAYFRLYDAPKSSESTLAQHIWQFGQTLNVLTGASAPELLEAFEPNPRHFRYQTARHHPEYFNKEQLKASKSEILARYAATAPANYPQASKRMNRLMTACSSIFDFERPSPEEITQTLQDIINKVENQDEELHFTSMEEIQAYYGEDDLEIPRVPLKMLKTVIFFGILNVPGQNGTVYQSHLDSVPVFTYKTRQSPEEFLASNENVKTVNIVAATDEGLEIESGNLVAFTHSSLTGEYLYLYQGEGAQDKATIKNTNTRSIQFTGAEFKRFDNTTAPNEIPKLKQETINFEN